MDLMPVAFSVHNFISSVGADAGFAAIIGLAVLILLYFAHARETANLREEASILAERLQQAEARVAELSRPQPVESAVPAAEAVQVTDRRGTDEHALPFAPAGVGAPALAAATRVVHLPELAPEPRSLPTAAPAPAAAMAGAASAASAAPGAASRGITAAPAGITAAPAPAPAPAASAPAPAPAAPAPASGAGAPASASPGMPRPATAAGSNGGGRGAGGAVATAPPPARASTTGFDQLPPLGEPAQSRSRTGRRIVIGLLALALVAAAVVALVVLTRSSSSSPTSARQTPTTNAPAPRAPATFSPASVTVAVLNGTATNQLAHRVADKLAASGYRKGTIATAATQTETSTVIAYLPGPKNRRDALHVATALNLKPTAVHPIDQATQQVACPAPGPCTANVIVTVGSDLATL